MIAEMEWVEVVLPAGSLADEVAALLADDAVAAAGVELRGEDIIVWAPAAEADAAVAALRSAARRISDAGLPLDADGVRARPAVPEDEWRDAWKRYFTVARVTPRIVIVPSWERHTAAHGDVVLDLDPGRAFGTGAHASTKLCLRALDDLAGWRFERFLDIGTGSGILAIAAAKLWPAATGVAVDVDPLAVDCAIENLERNGVLGRVAASDTTVSAVPGVFDLVLANIQADVLEDLREAVVARVAPGGTLVLSGLLEPQARPVADAYVAAGLRLAATDSLPGEEWAALILQRP